MQVDRARGLGPSDNPTRQECVAGVLSVDLIYPSPGRITLNDVVGTVLPKCRKDAA